VRIRAAKPGNLSRWAAWPQVAVVAGIFALFLLAFAGIPLTSGFTGKFAVSRRRSRRARTPLVIVGVLSSAVAAFFYVRVIVLMFFSDPIPDGPQVVMPGCSPVRRGARRAGHLVLGIVPNRS